MDITITGLTAPQSRALLGLAAAYAHDTTLPRRSIHPRTLTVLQGHGLTWTQETSAGITTDGLAMVTAALRPLVATRLASVHTVADRTWLPQTVWAALEPAYAGWHLSVRHTSHTSRPTGTLGPYLTVLPARYHLR